MPDRNLAPNPGQSLLGHRRHHLRSYVTGRYGVHRDSLGCGFERDSFGWVAPPVLNPYTRIAVEMNAALGRIRVLGYERPADQELAVPVTQRAEFSFGAIAA